MLVDLALKLDRPGVVIDALGMKMYVTFLHALLHARTGIPIIPITNIPHPDGTCTVTAHPPLKFPPGASYQEITQGCWDFFEPFIRARPDLWLWTYRHWRYKPKDAAREYPFYSHVAKKFDQAIAQPIGAQTKAEGLTEIAGRPIRLCGRGWTFISTHGSPYQTRCAWVAERQGRATPRALRRAGQRGACPR